MSSLDALPSSTRPAKRQKTARACDQCISSKTRCDDHTSEGCGRCLKLGKGCSFRQVSSTPIEASQQYSATAQVDGARLAEMEAKIERLEAIIKQQQAGVGAAGGTTSQISDATALGQLVPPRHPSRSSEVPKSYTIPSLVDVDQSYRWPFSERLSAVLDDKGFTCLISQGHITAAEADIVYHSWRHRLTTTIPLSPFLLSSTQRPSHPFLTAIIISQSQHAASNVAVQAIKAGIERILAGDVSVLAMMGLLLLALDRPSTLLPSSVRLNALARDVGESLGLEAREEVALRRGADLMSPLWESTLEDLLLWESVKIYYNLIHLFFTPLRETISSSIHHFASVPSHFSRFTIAHLATLNSITSTFQPMLSKLSVAEAQAHTKLPDMHHLTVAWSQAQPHLDSVRASNSSSIDNILLLAAEHSISYRAIRLFQSLPTPIHPDHISPHQNTWGSELCRLSTNLLSAFIDFPPDLFLPSIVHSSLITSVATILTVHATVFRYNPHYFEANLDKAHRAEEKLRDMGGMCAFAIERVREEFVAKWGRADRFGDRTDGVSETGQDPGSTDGGNGEGIDWSEVDLSVWSWLYEAQNG